VLLKLILNWDLIARERDYCQNGWLAWKDFVSQCVSGGRVVVVGPHVCY
jgi:hypothetical protein